MAIGSVYELVDYKQETIKLAKKYGGGTLESRVQELELDVEQLSGSLVTVQGELEDKTDLDVIADEYDPNGSSGYSKGDTVIYDGRLYVANETVLNQAGEWKIQEYVAEYTPTYGYYRTGVYVVYDGSLYIALQDSYSSQPHYPTDPQYWELVEDVEDFDASETYNTVTVVKYLGRYAKAYDNGRLYSYGAIPISDYTEGTTYNTGTYVVYNSGVYKALQTTSTTWVDEEWTNVDAEDWSPTDSFKKGDIILHSGTYYELSSSYKNMGLNGPFDTTKWTEKTVIDYVEDKPEIIITDFITVSGTTDENGFLIISNTSIAEIFSSGGIILRAVPDYLMGNYCEVPYGMAYNAAMLKLRFYDNTGSILESTELTNFKFRLVYIK